MRFRLNLSLQKLLQSLRRFSVPRGAALALGSAVLFGASTPLAKIALTTVDPRLLAGLLYLSSAFGLAAWQALRRLSGRVGAGATLPLQDLPLLATVIVVGGVAGPWLLMVGLAQTPASTASLLLNLEGLATLLIAWMVFREHVNRRLLLGALAILFGAALLSWQTPGGGATWGTLAIMAACLAWGIDNNLTRRLIACEPVQLALIKSTAAGSVNLLLALSLGAALPPTAALLGIAVIGVLGYGVSLVLFITALRELGAARSGAYFSTAPFVGALLGLAIFGEPVTWQLIVTAMLMGFGLYLHLSERHEHDHEHILLEHDHEHVHDLHHQHAHDVSNPAPEAHSHRHQHGPLRHHHGHYPDIHHRHGH